MLEGWNEIVSRLIVRGLEVSCEDELYDVQETDMWDR